MLERLLNLRIVTEDIEAYSVMEDYLIVGVPLNSHFQVTLNPNNARNTKP